MGIVLNHDQYAAFEERVLSHYRRNPGTTQPPPLDAHPARKHASIGEKVHPLTHDSRKDL